MFSKIIFVFVLILGSFAHFLAGACTDMEQTSAVEKCENSFVDSMVKDANANCSVELNKMQSCLTDLSKKCYPTVQDAVTKQLVDIAMKQFKTVEFYCSTANNIVVNWPNIAVTLQDKLPCSSKAATNESSFKCSQDFREKLHKTPRDSQAIYKSYEESISCRKKETDKFCKNPASSNAVIYSTAITLQIVILLNIYNLFM